MSQDLSSVPGPSRRELLGVGALLLLFFGVLSVTVVVDNDEGYYLTAAKLVYQGKVLYRDFFFTQAPYLPYIHGLWLKIVGASWYTARIPNVLASVLLGTLLYHGAFTRGGYRKVAVWSVVLYAGSVLVVYWYPVAKTYSITALLLFASYQLIAKGTAEDRGKLILIAGALAGVAVGIRLMCLGVVPILFVLAGKRGAGWLLAGGVLALLPCLLAYSLDPEAYMFNNLGYHSLRTEDGLIGNLPQKLNTLSAAIGINYADSSLPVQHWMLLVLLFGAVAYRKIEMGPLALGLGLIAVSMLPTPVYMQYFCMAVPFVIASLRPYLQHLCGSKEQTRFLHYLLAPYLLATVVGISAATGTASPDYKFGEPVHRSISNLRGITRTIEQYSKPGETVISSWPGYVVEVDRVMLAGTENNFPHQVALMDRLTEQEANRFKMLTDAQLMDAIRARAADIAIIGEGMKDAQAMAARHQTLIESGYQMVSTDRGVGVYALTGAD